MDKRNLIKNGAVIKLAAAVAALTLIAAASLLPAKAEPAQLTDPDVLNPAPVVMTIEEADEAVIEEESSDEEEKKQKMGFFTRLKLAFYAFCAGAGAWIAHKIPWGKIFNKRNLIIVLVLAAACILAWKVGLPVLTDYLKEAV
ncbi:MAG: hypothetical protein IKU09_02840 [Firmicutes bacterium]|nr:hypothetical protein [Bacillota bacterium]